MVVVFFFKFFGNVYSNGRKVNDGKYGFYYCSKGCIGFLIRNV